jgi:sulfatase maturation enzyme AslB (radical SAM superfamily)
MGNLMEAALTDIWDSPAVADVRSATAVVPPGCRQCHLVPLCVDRCPGHAHAQYGCFQRRDPLCYRQVEKLVPDIVHECLALARQKVGSWKLALPTAL